MEPTEKILRANGVDICTQSIGDPANPAILLIHGAASSMDWWEDDFCERLAAGPRFVIRYDHRDTGRSVSYPPGNPLYAHSDLAEDAVGVLDALGVARAHVVGLSMGGGIGQRVAVTHPERVASLTLIATSPGGPGASNGDLPPMSEELEAVFGGEIAEPDWTDRAAVVEYIVDSTRPYAGSLPFDEAGVRAIAGRAFDRTANMASSMSNHFLAEQGEPVRKPLRAVAAPTLVIHGAEDPLLPLAHGQALADQIPGAELLVLEQTGHELPRAVWDVVVPRLLEHTASG